MEEPSTHADAEDSSTTSTATVAAPSTLPEVPGYVIQGVLGQGGMALVLRGLDPKFNRVLAVKVLKDKHRGNTELTARFLEEAQITGQLQNPGIPPVHDLGRLPDGRPFFTIKVVQGRTLQELLAARESTAADLPRFLVLFGQVCQTLAYAHSHGVIHRDLKPSNVMVGKFDEVQVMDWGFAKVLGQMEASDPGTESMALLQTVRSAGLNESSVAGSIFGTPAFMAPEQARGETDRLDERCDVFGLGGILCVILTGQPPYTPAKGDVLPQAQKGQIADAVARLEACGADAELIDLARGCLSADKEARPRDAGAVSRAIVAYQSAM
jgi:serine/threonine-protein kinase